MKRNNRQPFLTLGCNHRHIILLYAYDYYSTESGINGSIILCCAVVGGMAGWERRGTSGDKTAGWDSRNRASYRWSCKRSPYYLLSFLVDPKISTALLMSFNAQCVGGRALQHPSIGIRFYCYM